MKSNQFAVLVVVAFIGGIAGGFVSDQVGSIGPAFASGEKKLKIIEANEFRVVDDKGKALASLKSYENKSPPYALLAFYGEKKENFTQVKSMLSPKGLSVYGDSFNTSCEAEGMEVSSNYGSATQKSIYVGMSSNTATFNMQQDYRLQSSLSLMPNGFQNFQIHL